ncbi:DUF938 domain-containing protein [Maricaulis sp.]|uniref:DUF938 domain-containing protein n=1 Tax=Maricaulis sp. TaxID=1486257 RepID=UPI002618F18E|nr:DUF938 domain-containing protein [Maricaulis sp.]
MSASSDTPPALEARRTEAERLFSPSAGRNRHAIAEVLAEALPADARVLEIGSGTGEHAATLLGLRADVVWQPSDPDPASRLSQDAWGSDFDGRMKPALALDLARPGWMDGLGPFDAIVSMNVIHIAPWEVALSIAEGAQHMLAPHGLVYFYGPFQEGELTAPSNLDFDRSLKARNPDWGVRKLEEVRSLMGEIAFHQLQRIEMPANNLSLIFRTGVLADASS